MASSADVNENKTGNDDDRRRTDETQKQAPPTVPGWPLVGNLFDLKMSAMHHTLTDWAVQHGPVYTIHLFRTPYVVVSTETTVRQAADRARSRSLNPGHVIFSEGGKDIFLGNYDEAWRFIRKEAETSMQRHTKDIANLDDLMNEEVEDFISVCCASEGESVDLYDTLASTFLSMIVTLIIGEKLERNGGKMQCALELVRNGGRVLSPIFASELSLLPFLRNFDIFGMKTISETLRRRDLLLDPYIQKNQESLEAGESRSYLQLLMGAGNLTEEQMKIVCMHYPVGGTFAPQTVTLVTILQLLQHPDVMQKLQSDIDGLSGRIITPADRPKLPLLQAAILETLRFATVTPLVPRVAHQDTSIAGYHVPKDTTILMNLWGVMHDQEFWKDPDVWRPERFLDPEGQILPSSHPFMRCIPLAFGGGIRTCLGRQFAPDQIFRLVARLLQQCDLQADPDYPLPQLNKETMTLQTKITIPRFRVKVLPRTKD